MRRITEEFGITVDKNQDEEDNQKAASSSSSLLVPTNDKRLTLSQAISQRLGICETLLTIDDYITSLKHHKDVWKEYLRTSTAISGAGATYSVCVYIIPGDNALTGNKAASVVGTTRA